MDDRTIACALLGRALVYLNRMRLRVDLGEDETRHELDALTYALHNVPEYLVDARGRGLGDVLICDDPIAARWLEREIASIRRGEQPLFYPASPMSAWPPREL